MEAALAKCLSFYVKVFYVIGKELIEEFSCLGTLRPCSSSNYLALMF